jgi:hypothetical protein
MAPMITAMATSMKTVANAKMAKHVAVSEFVEKDSKPAPLVSGELVKAKPSHNPRSATAKTTTVMAASTKT